MLVKDEVLKNIESKQYTIKFAKTEDEVTAALKLRYQVFKKELDRDFGFDDGIDVDQYDDQAHHLIVVHNESDTVVGTYRMQTYEEASRGNGFVSGERYLLEDFPEEVLKDAVEVGRACIRKEHRSGRVLFLLWKGFAGYLNYFQKRYLFGYTALESKDPDVLLNTYDHLKQNGFVHNQYNVGIRKEFQLSRRKPSADSDEIDVPPLLQNYLDVGSRVCSLPSMDRELELAHFLILLDIENIPERTQKLFFS